MPLNPLVRSRDVQQTVWPGSPGDRHIIHDHRIVHGACRLGRGCFGIFGVKFNSKSSFAALAFFAQSSLPSSLSSSGTVLPAGVHQKR